MKILTIESTCDETAAAVITDEFEILSSVVASQEPVSYTHLTLPTNREV